MIYLNQTLDKMPVRSGQGTEDQWISYLKTLGKNTSGSTSMNSPFSWDEEPMVDRWVPYMFEIDYGMGHISLMNEQTRELAGATDTILPLDRIDALTGKMHPDDLRDYDQQGFGSDLPALAAMPAEDRAHAIFTHDIRIRERSGSYARMHVHIRHKAFTPEGLPRVSLYMMFRAVEEKGGEWTPSGASRISVPLQRGAGQDQINLTVRETEILRMTARGMTSREIAEELGLSFNTVNNHRMNILQKAKARNVIELVTIAVRNGLL